METTTETTNAKQGWNEAAQASAIAQAEAAHPPRTFKESLPVKLTAAELADVGKKAAAARREIEKFESEKSTAASHWKAKIELAENQRDEYLDVIESGFEEREVECIETFEFRTGVVTITRADTGEKIKERAMTSAERQPSLPGTEEAVTARVVDESDEPPADEHAITDPQATLDGAVSDGAEVKVKRRRRSES